MTTLAIDINDAGLVVAHAGGVLTTEPGYALVADGEVITGTVALRQARLKPRQVSNRYWAQLSLESGTAGVEGIGSAAELAFIQLEALWKRFGEKADDVLLVVPDCYTREQLGLLLGLAQECGIVVRGMVRAAAAVSARPHPGRQLIYLDAGLHRVSVTPLQQADGVLALDEEGLEGVGLANLSDLWAKRVAELFVLATRFDPFHQADTEQVVYDRLPDWLEALQDEDTVELEIDHGGQTHRAELKREQLLATASGFYRAVVQLVAQSRGAGAGLVLQVSHRLASLPGLVGELLRLDDAHVLSLEPDEAASGALSLLEAIGGEGSQVKLLKRLPWREEAREPAEVEAPQPKPQATGPRPSHVVYHGIAYPVDAEGLLIGRVKLNGRRSIVLDGEHGGVSGSHCELVQRDGELKLMDLSRYGTFVNEKRISGETTLHPADVIRIGSPGEELQVISLDEDHGA